MVDQYLTISLVVELRRNKEEKKEEVKIEIDKNMIVDTVCDYYYNRGYPILGLIFAFEYFSYDNIPEPISEKFVKSNISLMISESTLSDDDDSGDRVNSLIVDLKEIFNIPQNLLFNYATSEYRSYNNLSAEFRFLKLKKKSSILLFRLEEELLKSVDFISEFTAYPFLVDMEKDIKGLSKVMSLISYLENVVECMLIYECEALEEEDKTLEQDMHFDVAPEGKTK
jgi:hypothetical protein